MAQVSVNGRRYETPVRPTVVVCFDGCDPEYIRRGLADGILPTIAAFRETGFLGTAEAVVPTFTNPNNASIVTGVPPAVHGISGNYYLDRATGEERMITDGALMRCGTILAAMSKAGVRTAAVTAKDKLRLMLARGLDGISFSSEHADRATQAANGIGGVEAMVGRRQARPVFGRPVALRSRRGAAAAGAQGGEPALSVALRLRAARACAGHAGGRCLQPRRGRAARPACGGRRRRRRGGRSRHERQVASRRAAAGGVPAGRAQPAVRRSVPCG